MSLFEIYICWYVVTGRNIEYEYTVTNNNLQLDKIMNKSRRKEILSIDIKKIEGFEKLGDGRLNENRCDKVMWLGTFEDDKLVFDDILGSGMKLTFAKEGER